MTDLFVYGTLKKGSHNHRRLGDDATFQGIATTTGLFRMWCVGFPLIRPAERGDPMAGHVTGEVWRVTPRGLLDVDILEGNGSMYRRQLVAVRGAGGHVRHVQGYVWLGGPRGDALMPVGGLLTWRS